MTGTTLIHDASQVVRISEDGIDAIADGSIAITDGTVDDIGTTAEITEKYPVDAVETVIDASGKTVLPGYVDPHTHAVFAGERINEFVAKLSGKSYQEIQSEGGGILSTVRSVRDASLETLTENLLDQLDVMLAYGTTTAEVKSGYGLSTDAELKLLEAVDRANGRHAIDVIPTFLGAHAVPDEQEEEAYVDQVINEQLPAVADNDLAVFCDVFCDEGAFSLDQSRRILEAGIDHGLTPKIHAEEFLRLGGAQLAGDLEAASADHLLQATEEDAESLAEGGVTPVLLPGTAFTLGAEYAKPTLFEDAGASVALASDFNPNCYSQSMEFTISLACNGMRMTPTAALRGATQHAAEALQITDGRGTLQEGAPGDVIIADVPRFEYIPYNTGVQTTETVLKDGQVVHNE
ncbi:imidazolonepropionase [Halopenitus persicus]|uniref:Imidazolonepropionase n=1 Tax=Halopenitus persicus TaxID=1048396 RepID=A0A1H3LAU5_9EURY|nr:imidazolonepropionase [Halopenitus persicus]SDY61416.1 imidazolonepropionase [Halopenitus persicus]